MPEQYDAAAPIPPYDAGSTPVTDAERAAALDQLRRGYDDGWLSPDEHELRDTLARRARTRAELAEALRPGVLGEGSGAEMRAGPVSPVPPLVTGPPASPRVSGAPAGSAGWATGSESTAHQEVEAGIGSTAVQPAATKPESGLIRVSGQVAASLHTLAWMAAVAGFFSTGRWWWFLLIPLSHVLVGGRAAGEDAEERRRRRRARRDARRIRRGRPPILGEVVRGDEQGPPPPLPPG